MSVIALGAIFALASIAPLKSYEPYMIVVDKSSGFVEVKRPMAEGSLSQDEVGDHVQRRALCEGARDI